MRQNQFENMTDEELLSQMREGYEADETVTDYLMEKYKNLVRSRANKMFLPGADKDDLIQEGMIGLLKAIRGYDAGRDASFFTFADLCVARYIMKAVDAGNRKKHAPLNSYISLYEKSTFTDADGGSTSDNAAGTMEMLISLSERNPEDLIIDRESAENLEKSINEALSDFERQVLNLHMRGMGYVEIARLLGRDAKSTDNALSRAKAKVKKIVTETRFG